MCYGRTMVLATLILLVAAAVAALRAVPGTRLRAVAALLGLVVFNFLCMKLGPGMSAPSAYATAVVMLLVELMLMSGAGVPFAFFF